MKTFILFTTVSMVSLCAAENIDPYGTGAQYGWSENTGWMNFQPSQGPGVQVEGGTLSGFVWGENIGWINLSCQTTGYCGTVNYGVVNDGAGNLSGFAWAENAGWLNFGPTYGGVTIDADGRLNGWAWGENIGWVRFNKSQSWSVRACVVTLDDLTNFASYWLEGGSTAGNLDKLNGVDMDDYAIFASYWKDFCPDGWLLK